MIDWKNDTLEAFDLYNINPDKAMWVDSKELDEAPQEEFEALTRRYKLIFLTSELDKVFLEAR